MKKFLKNSALFCVVGFLSYILIVCVLGSVVSVKYTYHTNISYRPAAYGHLQTRIEDIQNHPDVDLLFIGSSHAYRSFDPRIFDQYGYSSFNLGSSSQSPEQSLYVLKKYFAQLNPDTVIIEVYPEVFTMDGIEAATDFISNDSLDLKMMKWVFSMENIRILNTLIIRIFDREIRNKTYDEPKHHGDDQYIDGGFVAVDWNYQREKSNPAQTTLNYRQSQFNAFYSMLSFLEQKDTPYILVQAPYTRKLYSSFTNLESFDKKMAAAGPYFNFNEIMTLDKSDFYDSDHLNQRGVYLFNTYLLEHILHKKRVKNTD